MWIDATGIRPQNRSRQENHIPWVTVYSQRHSNPLSRVQGSSHGESSTEHGESGVLPNIDAQIQGEYRQYVVGSRIFETVLVRKTQCRIGYVVVGPGHTRRNLSPETARIF